MSKWDESQASAALEKKWRAENNITQKEIVENVIKYGVWNPAAFKNPPKLSQWPDALFILILGAIWTGSTWLCSSWGFWQSVVCAGVGIGLVLWFGKK